MIEMKEYDNLAYLISDTRKWLDENYQNRPYKFVVHETDEDTIDCEADNTVESCLNFLESNISDYLNNKNGYLLLRKNKIERDIEDEEIIIFVMEKNNKNEKVLQNKKDTTILEDIFYKCKTPIIAIHDGRFSAVCMMECFLEEEKFFSEKEISNFSSLEDENKIFELYDIYQKDCMEFNKQVFSPENSDCESLKNLKNNLN